MSVHTKYGKLTLILHQTIQANFLKIIYQLWRNVFGQYDSISSGVFVKSLTSDWKICYLQLFSQMKSKTTRVWWSVWCYHWVWSGAGIPKAETKGQNHRCSYATPTVLSINLLQSCLYHYCKCFANKTVSNYEWCIIIPLKFDLWSREKKLFHTRYPQ